MKRLVILGAGTAGTMMAHHLRRALPVDWRITVVDRSDKHLYQPGLLFVPFGQADPDSLVRPRRPMLPPGVDVRLAPIDRVDPEYKRVRFENGETLPYDVLVIATGSQILPAETPGLTGPGWHQSAFDFYTLEGATALARTFERFAGGKVVVHFVDMPIKCPVAPLELAFLADAYFTRRGIRDKVELVYATPLDGAFTKPRASAMLSQLFDDKGIQLEANFQVERVDGERLTMSSYDGREIDYDLLVTVPLHGGSDVIAASGLGDHAGFVPTDKHTLAARDYADVFVLGDATDLPSSKAGSVAHFQAEVLTENIARFARGLAPLPGFDGHANCFIETGHDKALLIDFNYDTEPLPGRWPLPGIGPFTLLEESRVNHMGKLGFEWLYWNVLMKGGELPVSAHMLAAGKWS